MNGNAALHADWTLVDAGQRGIVADPLESEAEGPLHHLRCWDKE